MSRKNVDPFEPQQFYHIFNKSINQEKLFYSKRNYKFFLNRYKKYLSNFLDTYNYCLIPNHFHLLARVKSEIEADKTVDQKIIDQFRKFFISYVQSINKQEGRTGSLLQKKFKRRKIKDENHLIWTVYYIHRNPIHHNICSDLKDYEWSSYQSLLSSQKTELKRKEIHALFGGRTKFIKFHDRNLEIDKKYNYFILE